MNTKTLEKRARRDTILTVGRTQNMVTFALGDTPPFNVTAASARKMAQMLCDAAHDSERGTDVLTPTLITVLDGCEWS